MDDLKEHIGLLIVLIGGLVSIVGTCLAIIWNQLKEEIKTDREQREENMHDFSKKVDKIEGYLERITDELFERMRKAEASLGKLWAEHRLIKDFGGCSFRTNNHSEDDEHGITGGDA